MKKILQRIGIGLGLIVVLYVGIYYATFPKYEFHSSIDLNQDFNSFYKLKLEETKSKKGRVGSEEKLIRFSPGKTENAILYIHGFGASRAEGEATVDQIASKLKANTYYLRLPGHGTNNEDHRDTPFTEYLRVAEETFLMMDKLGNHTILMGTSMGGLISTYLASKYPDKVRVLVLYSPFYDFSVPLGRLFFYPGGTALGETIQGKIRKSPPKKPDDGIGEHYYEYWYKDQYLAAVKNVSEATKFVLAQDPFPKITSPTLLVYYYKDKDHQDKTASVTAMLDAFSKIGGEHPNPLNTKVAIEEGSHVLTSTHVHSDKPKVEATVLDFLKKAGIR
ncbi:alpha/beta hydrolase [Leptospira langatensis]|uniref:Alpha/beta hydrolase n=1 Tax=Leptospira langatensis TaxID=2484983 RepID=A0A5F1ZZJ2_9LEPT|nr:alpha/beta hydrolase [Leptospira langatensis]TGJ98485.1 alpha/beta hydrolase [Leptospira langatensis]TGL43399.1 alpha/beta hydrolase [Leptospira langatensis]